MRTNIGIVLMLLSIPYAVWGATHGHGPLVYMGVIALFVFGGLMIARSRNRTGTARRPDLMAVPKPSSPPAPEADVRPETTPAGVVDARLDRTLSSPASEGFQDRQATILPPPPAAAGKPHLRLVHTDGIRMTPEQLRYKAK